MAKQLINVGSQANDGTGDSIRSGAQKINATLNEIYNNIGDGTVVQISISNVTSGNVLRSNGENFVSAKLNYSDLSGLPTIPAAQVQSDWNSTSGPSYILNKPTLFSGVYDDLTNKPTLSDVAESGDYDDLNNRPSLSDVALSGDYNDLLNLPTVFSGDYEDLTNLPALSTVATTGDYEDLLNLPDLENIGVETLNELTDVTITSASSGQVVRYDGTSWVNSQLSYNDLSNTPASLSPSRTTVSATTGSLASGASQNLDVTGFKSYIIMKIQTSRAAWVTVYTDQTSRTNDASRLQTVDPEPGSGVIAEVTTTGNETILLTPGTIGFNNDSIASNYIYMKVRNESGSTGSIEVTLTLLQLEL